jgi:hypothetical protein
VVGGGWLVMGVGWVRDLGAGGLEQWGPGTLWGWPK